MNRYIVLFALIISSISLNAQLRMTASLATSALNSNVTKPVVLKSVNNSTPAYSAGMSGNFSATVNSSPGVTSAAVTNAFNTISSRFGYYTAFYAQLITVSLYSGYYHNVPVAKYLPPYGEYYQRYGTIAIKEFEQFRPHYNYFNEYKPGFIPYQNDRPATVHIDIGISRPVPLQVDPAKQSYPLNNTRFIKSVSLNY
ncbi:MAG: hypothetical protein EOO42_09735 [Flavobacteriales bacterium]|nr:MAG: hypothetical protein EOO42_09735 [Flavobacteriales bacterium]